MRFPEAVDYLLAYHGRSRDFPTVTNPSLAPGRQRYTDHRRPGEISDHAGGQPFLQRRERGPGHGPAPGGRRFHTRSHWKDLCCFVLDPELKNGASIFTRSSTGRGYNLTNVHNITQTQGRELRTPQLRENTEAMDAALTALLNFSPAQVVADENLSAGAYYDPRKMTLAVNSGYSDSQAFAAIAAQIAQARFHDRGFNPEYNREGCELSAQSVSYIFVPAF